MMRMAQPELHDLAAAYALNALDPEDRWTYELHLNTCERCRQEVAELRESAAELAYAGEGPAPPKELRERIIRAAREERPGAVVPLRRRRWLLPATAAVAVAASFAAIGLGLWANSVRNDQVQQRVIPTEGAAGQLIVSGNDATLVTCLDAPPPNKTYEAWVIEGGTARPAGLFSGGCRTVELSRPVRSGNTFAVTVEDEAGAQTPHTKPFMSANV
jgi:anti-sigma-K factor RskA